MPAEMSSMTEKVQISAAASSWTFTSLLFICSADYPIITIVKPTNKIVPSLIEQSVNAPGTLRTTTFIIYAFTKMLLISLPQHSQI